MISGQERANISGQMAMCLLENEGRISDTGMENISEKIEVRSTREDGLRISETEGASTRMTKDVNSMGTDLTTRCTEMEFILGKMDLFTLEGGSGESSKDSANFESLVEDRTKGSGKTVDIMAREG